MGNVGRPVLTLIVLLVTTHLISAAAETELGVDLDEGQVVASTQCCGHSLNYVAAQNTYSAGAENCYNKDSIPYYWIPQIVDNFQFIQYNFKTPKIITRIKSYSICEYDEWALTDYEPTYSQDAQSFTPYNDLSSETEKYISSDVAVVYLRIYLKTNQIGVGVFFRVYGEDYNQAINVVDFQTSGPPCPGYDLSMECSALIYKPGEVVSSNANLQIIKKATESDSWVEVTAASVSNNIRYKFSPVEALTAFHKVIYSLDIHNFQNEDNGIYGCKYIDGSSEHIASNTLEAVVIDPGSNEMADWLYIEYSTESDTQGFIASYAIAGTPEDTCQANKKGTVLTKTRFALMSANNENILTSLSSTTTDFKIHNTGTNQDMCASTVLGGSGGSCSDAVICWYPYGYIYEHTFIRESCESFPTHLTLKFQGTVKAVGNKPQTVDCTKILESGGAQDKAVSFDITEDNHEINYAFNITTETFEFARFEFENYPDKIQNISVQKGGSPRIFFDPVVVEFGKPFYINLTQIGYPVTEKRVEKESLTGARTELSAAVVETLFECNGTYPQKTVKQMFFLPTLEYRDAGIYKFFDLAKPEDDKSYLLVVPFSIKIEAVVVPQYYGDIIQLNCTVTHQMAIEGNPHFNFEITVIGDPQPNVEEYITSNITVLENEYIAYRSFRSLTFQRRHNGEYRCTLLKTEDKEELTYVEDKPIFSAISIDYNFESKGEVGLVDPPSTPPITFFNIYNGKDFLFMANEDVNLKLDLDTNAKIELKKVCEKNGGGLARATSDFWDFYRTLLLVSFSQSKGPISPPKPIYFALIESNGIKVRTFLTEEVDTPNQEPELIVSEQFKDVFPICAFELGQIYKFIDFDAPRNCRYLPLAEYGGVKKDIQILLHGSEAQTVFCFAHKSKIDNTRVLMRNFSVNHLQNITYELSYEERRSELYCYTAREPDFIHKFSFHSELYSLEFNDKDIQMSPNFLFEPDDAHQMQPNLGETVFLQCSANGNPIPRFYWKYFDNKKVFKATDLPDVNSYDVISDNCNETLYHNHLVFSPLQRKHFGYYFCCVAQEGLGDRECNDDQYRSDNIRVFPKQVSPLSTSINYVLDCDAASVKAMLDVMGSELTFCKLGCSSDESFSDDDLENCPVPERKTGANRYVWTVSNPNKNTRCVFKGSNQYVPESPIRVESSMRGFNFVRYLIPAFDANTLTLSCTACGFGLTSERVFRQFACAEGVEMQNATTVQVDEPNFLITVSKRLKKYPKFTSECGCALEMEVSKLTLFANGEFEVDAHIVTDPPLQEEKESFQTTAKAITLPPEIDETTTESGIIYVNSSSTGPKIDMDPGEYQFRLLLSDLEEGKTSEEVIGFVVKKNLHKMAKSVNDSMTISVAKDMLDIVNTLMNQNWSCNTTEPCPREMRKDLVYNISFETQTIIENTLFYSPKLAQDENFMTERMVKLANLSTNLAQFMYEDSEVDIVTENIAVKVRKIPDDPSTITENMTLTRRDKTGVTIGSVETVSVTTTSLTSLPAGSVISVLIADKPMVDSQLKLIEEFPSYMVNGRTRVVNYSKQRNSKLIVIKAEDSEGEEISLPDVVFCLNHYRSVIPLDETKNTVTKIKVECAYFDFMTNKFETDGVDVIFATPSRTCCRSSHTSAFGVMANVEQEKTDEEVFVVHYEIFYCGGFIGLFFILLTFFILLYLDDVLDHEKTRLAMTECIVVLIILCCILTSLDKIEYKTICYVTTTLLHFACISLIGCLLNSVIYLYKEVQPRLWNYRHLPMFYLMSIWIIPMFISGLTTLIFKDHYANEISCWLNSRYYHYWTFAVPILVYLLCIVVGLMMFRCQAKSITSQLGEDIPIILSFVLRNTVLQMPIVVATLFLLLFSPQSTSIHLHVVFSSLLAILGITLFLVFILLDAEVRIEWVRKRKAADSDRKRIMKKVVKDRRLARELKYKRRGTSSSGKSSKQGSLSACSDELSKSPDSNDLDFSFRPESLSEKRRSPRFYDNSLPDIAD